MEQMVTDYFNPAVPGSYAGLSTFVRDPKRRKELEKILTDYPAYSLHKPVRKRFPRNKTIVGHMDSLWQLDLSVLTHIADYNDGYKYLLCAIDVLSKKAFVEPVKTKKPADVRDALKRIFRRTDRRPNKIMSDKGKELTGKEFQAYLREMKIGFYHSNNEETKASVVERFQRTLKSRLWRYFRQHNTWRYLDVLPSLVDSYNNTYHRSIGQTPDSVNVENEAVVWQRLYGHEPSGSSDYTFQVGDHVRIASSRSYFKKGYESGWSEEIFRVVKRHRRRYPVYSLEDLLGEDLEGTFYEKELQKVNLKDDYFVVDKVHKKRRRNGTTEHFVSFRGWPPKFNQWVTEMKQI